MSTGTGRRRSSHLAEQAAENRPPAGIPIPEGLEGVDAVTVLRQHEIEAKQARKGNFLDEVFAGGLTYHSLGEES